MPPRGSKGALPPAARRGLAPSVPSLAPAAGLLLPVVAFINFTLYHLLYALSRQKYTGGGRKGEDTGNCRKNMVCWLVKICFEENPAREQKGWVRQDEIRFCFHHRPPGKRRLGGGEHRGQQALGHRARRPSGGIRPHSHVGGGHEFPHRSRCPRGHHRAGPAPPLRIFSAHRRLLRRHHPLAGDLQRRHRTGAGTHRL